MSQDMQGVGATNGETILVVDDDELLCRSICRTLKRCGYSTLETGGAQEALELLESRTVDAMVLDIRMPGINGHAMLQELRRRGLWVPVIMTSGDASLEDAVSAFRTGAVVDFLSKPFPAEELAGAIQRALHGDEHAAPRQPTRSITAAQAVAGSSSRAPTRSFTSAISRVPAATARRPTPPADRGGRGHLMAGVRRRIRTGRIALPAPPGAILVIAAALRDPAIEEESIATAIRADASLTVHVVRAALELATRRTPGKAHRPDGLLRAVQRLGPRCLLTVAVAHTKRRSHRAFQLTELEALSQRLARRTERTAEAVHILAELIGRDCPLEDRAEVHVAEFGESLLLHAVESALLDGVPLPDPTTVRHELARHHAAFGAAAADQWGLGDRLRNLIRHHHEPDPIESLGGHPELRDTVFLQALGRATARRAMSAPALESDGPQIEECLAVLGLSRGGFEAAVERLKSHLKGSRLAA